MTLKRVNTDGSDLVLLPLAPLLFALYLHLLSQTLPSPHTMPAAKSTDTTPQHGEYYINGADLIVRVRVLLIETVSLSKTANYRWRTRFSAYIVIFSLAIRRTFALKFHTHLHPVIQAKAARIITR